MYRNKKKRNLIMMSLLGVLLCMTLGYAAFSTNLKISGTSKVTSNWNIEITNVTSGTPTGTAENTVAPTWDSLTASMEADLYEKGDAMEYDITIENKGTVDAKLNDVITNLEKSNSEAVNISFSGYTKGEKLKAKESKVVHVKIEYNPNYQGGETSSEVEIKFDYVQNNNETETPANTFLVKYDCLTNGGKDCSNNNEYLVTGSNVDLTKKGTKDKYEFIGWNIDKDAKEGLTSLLVEQNDITLYAIFKAIDETAPIIDNVSTSSTTNSITTVITAHDDESGISKYEFSINNEEYIDNGNNNVYTFNNLKASTDYDIKVRVTNGVGMQTEKALGGVNLKDNVVTQGDGLYKDAYEEGRYIYKGGTPNNYITFNNEIWRILSVEADGKIKIVRNETLLNKGWDEAADNNWARPSTLNTYLNEEYLNGITVNKDKIETSTWNIGPVVYTNTDLNKQVTTDEKSETWNGKVGLVTASEYIRTSNNSACKSQKDYYSNSSCYENNSTHNWLHLNSNWWTLSPYSGESIVVFSVRSNGRFRDIHASTSYGVRPAIYLSSNITLTGSGTQQDPYKINDKIGTPTLEKPTYKESGVLPKTVTITYPKGCGSNLKCTYQKDNGNEVEVKSETANVEYDQNGTLVAKVSDGTNEVSSNYTVTIKLKAEDLSYDNSQTKLPCQDAQCALDELKKQLK